MQKTEDIKELAAALAKARGAFREIKKTSNNPFYKSKYADLSEIIDATYKALSDNGLSVMQVPGEVNGGAVTILTMLLHASGQWVSEETTMPVKNDAQGIGSALTYGRRYALQGLLNVAAEEDDDGNGAVSKPFATQQHVEELDGRMEGQQRIAKFQSDELDKRWKASGWTATQVATFLSDLNNYVQLEEIQKQHFNDVLKAFSKAPAVPQDLVSALQQSVEVANAAKAACEACGSKVVPPGVSKAGKKYPAFCSNPNCPTRSKAKKADFALVAGNGEDHA